MKLRSKSLAVIMCGAAVLAPIAAFAADGNITARLIGHETGLNIFGFSLIGRRYYDVLPANRYHSLTYNLSSGNAYAITASCDDNYCKDIDLKLYDSNGNFIDSHTSNNIDPIVGVKPRWSGRYTLRVIMRGCRRAACEYGVQTLSK